MECRSRPTGFVEILFGCVCVWGGGGGGGGGVVGVTLAVKVTIFCRVKEEFKARGQQAVPAAVFAA